MRSNPDSSPAITSNGSSESSNGSTSEMLSLPQFWMLQNAEKLPNKVSSPQAEMQQKEAYRQILSNKEVTSQTRSAYADALTRELMAIRELQQESGVTLEDWQKRIMDAIDPSKAGKELFENVHSSSGLSEKEQDQYDQFRSVFEQLLDSGESDNPQEANEWLVTAMEVTKKQIVAVEAITQAQVHVVKEADKIDFVDDIEVMSTAFANETGRSIDEVRNEFVALQKDKLGNPSFKNIWGRLKNAVQTFRINRFKPEEKQTIQELWDSVKIEVDKDPYSLVDVQFPNGGTVDYTRTVNGQQLDAVQKKVVENLMYAGSRNTGRELGTKGRNEAAAVLKEMTGAQQNAYFALFDTQLRKQNQLNLVVQDPANPSNYLRTHSLLDPINPHIDGVAELPINLDALATLSIDQRLDLITDNIGKRTQERITKVERSEVRENIQARIEELESKKDGRKLTPQEQAQKEELTARKEAAAEIERLALETAKDEKEITTRGEELKDPIDKKAEIKTKTEEKSDKQKEKDNLEQEQTAKKAELDRVQSNIKTLQEKLGTAELTKEAVEAISEQIDNLTTQESNIKKRLVEDSDSLSNQIGTKNTEIQNLEKEIAERNEVVQKYESELAYHEELKAKHTKNLELLENLRDRYKGQNMSVAAIDRALQQFEGLSKTEQQEIDILRTFKDEIADQDKWRHIKLRSYSSSLSDVAMKARPHVQPAYLQMMSILGSEKVLADTPEGHKLYTKFSNVVTPRKFIQVYLQNPQRVARLQAAYNGVHGVIPTLDELTIYNDALKDPAIQTVMRQEVNRDFTTDILASLVEDAKNKTLGKLSQNEQDELHEIEDMLVPKDMVERQRDNLETTAKEMEYRYAVSSEMYTEQAAEDVLDSLYAAGADLEKAPQFIGSLHNALKAAGIDRDVVDADLTAGPMAAPLSDALTEAGLGHLNTVQQRSLINTVRKPILSREDIELYAKLQKLVSTINVSLSREQTPYIVAAVKRAALKAGFAGETLQGDELRSATGTLTQEGTILKDELEKIGVTTLNKYQQAKLVNGVLAEFIPQVSVRNLDSKLEGTKALTSAASSSIDMSDHGLIAYRTLLSETIDRSKPFTVGSVTPAIRAKVANEYSQLGIDINDSTDLWTDGDIADVIEIARPREDVSRFDRAPETNKQIYSVVEDAGFPKTEVYDAYRSTQRFIQDFNVPRQINEQVLQQEVNGVKLVDHFKQMVEDAVGNATTISGMQESDIASYINTVQLIPEAQVRASVQNKAEQIHKAVEQFLKYDGSFQDAAVLGVLLSEGDTDSISDILTTIENLQDSERTLVIILAKMSDPPRTYFSEKISHIQQDGARGFIDQYNALTGSAITTTDDIPPSDMRKLAGSVLAHRIGATTHPFKEAINIKQRDFGHLLNAEMNTAQFERSIQKLDAMFWGANDEKLTLEIQRLLGGTAHRSEAIIYSQAIMQKRTKEGFTQDQSES